MLCNSQCPSFPSSIGKKLPLKKSFCVLSIANLRLLIQSDLKLLIKHEYYFRQETDRATTGAMCAIQVSIPFSIFVRLREDLTSQVKRICHETSLFWGLSFETSPNVTKRHETSRFLGLSFLLSNCFLLS
jgi:hypothetical protein